MFPLGVYDVHFTDGPESAFITKSGQGGAFTIREVKYIADKYMRSNIYLTIFLA